MDDHPPPDLWVVTCAGASQGISLDQLMLGLDKRSKIGDISYRNVTVQSMVLAIENNKPCLYVDKVLEEKLPSVAFIYIPIASLFPTHMIHAVRHLEALGVRCINSSEAMIVCRNKLHQMQLLSKEGVTMPDTVSYATFTKDGLQDVIDAPHSVSFPAILKCARGCRGRRVMLLPSCDVAKDMLYSLQDDNVYMLQQYIQESHGTSVRVVVVGTNVHGMWRFSSPDSTRVSDAFHTEQMEIDEQLATIALQVTGTLGIEIAGLDFLQDSSGRWLFLEVNANPSLKPRYIGFVDSIITYCLKAIESNSNNNIVQLTR